MVTGAMRTVLWVLGSLGVIWLVLAVGAIPSMGRMMDGGTMPNGMEGGAGGGMIGGGGMMGGGSGSMMDMMSMMGMMFVQLLAMLGLVGVFVYLVVDTLRIRRARNRSGGTL